MPGEITLFFKRTRERDVEERERETEREREREREKGWKEMSYLNVYLFNSQGCLFHLQLANCLMLFRSECVLGSGSSGSSGSFAAKMS